MPIAPPCPRLASPRPLPCCAGTGDRVVLGEADDGGYYLIGLKRAHGHMFHRIDWSTSRVFKQSAERAREIGLDVARLAPWYDVDDAATISRLYRELVLSVPAERKCCLLGLRGSLRQPGSFASSPHGMRRCGTCWPKTPGKLRSIEDRTSQSASLCNGRRACPSHSRRTLFPEPAAISTTSS